MSAKTTLPGYSGYIPNFQTEYPLNKPVPAHKYEDIDPEDRVLNTDSMYTTNYMHTLDPKLKVLARRIRTEPQDSNVVGNFKRIEATRREMEATRRSNEYESRPTSNWGTTYNMQFNGWEQDRAARDRARRTMSAPQGGSRRMADYRQPGGVAYSSPLQGAHRSSDYTRSFGKFGDNPRNNYVPEDGKMVFSRRATSNDLFAGTNKGTVRIPGYKGYIPESRNNINTLRNNFPRNNKDNLIEIYRYNMPGYTGQIK